MTALEPRSVVSVLPPRLRLGAGSRIAIVRLGAIGDVVNTMPLLNTLRDGLPEARITWLVEPKSLPILAGHAALDDTIVFPRHHVVAEGTRFVREVRARRFDVVLDTQRLLKSAAVSLATGCGVRIAFDRARSKEFNWLFASAWLRPNPAPGVMVDQFREFASAIGLPLGPVRWNVPVGSEDRERARQVLEGVPRPFVVANLGASKPENLWPTERWADLTRALGDAIGVPVVWTGGRQDAARAERAALRHAPARNLVGATELKTLAAVLEGASLVVSCDTGPLHLAVAMGTPVVGLYGPADPRRTGPHGWLDHVVRPRGDARAMETLAVEDVVASVMRLRAAGRSRGAT